MQDKSKKTIMDIKYIAKIAHAAIRELCQSFGDESQSAWDSMPHWQKQSIISRVEFLVYHPEMTEGALHDHWMAEKTLDGWQYGINKNAETKTHPCMVPYNQLPKHQRLKNALIKAIVMVLK